MFSIQSRMFPVKEIEFFLALVKHCINNWWQQRFYEKSCMRKVAYSNLSANLSRATFHKLFACLKAAKWFQWPKVMKQVTGKIENVLYRTGPCFRTVPILKPLVQGLFTYFQKRIIRNKFYVNRCFVYLHINCWF